MRTLLIAGRDWVLSHNLDHQSGQLHELLLVSALSPVLMTYLPNASQRTIAIEQHHSVNESLSPKCCRESLLVVLRRLQLMIFT